MTTLPVEDSAADEIAMKDAANEAQTDSPVDRFVVVPWIVTTHNWRTGCPSLS